MHTLAYTCGIPVTRSQARTHACASNPACCHRAQEATAAADAARQDALLVRSQLTSAQAQASSLAARLAAKAEEAASQPGREGELRERLNDMTAFVQVRRRAVLPGGAHCSMHVCARLCLQHARWRGIAWATLGMCMCMHALAPTPAAPCAVAHCACVALMPPRRQVLTAFTSDGRDEVEVRRSEAALKATVAQLQDKLQVGRWRVQRSLQCKAHRCCCRCGAWQGGFAALCSRPRAVC